MGQWGIGAELKFLRGAAGLARTLVPIVLALGPAQPAMAARAGGPPGAMPELDTRRGERTPVTTATKRSRAVLEARLGREGFVHTDPVSGAVRFAGRTDGFLGCGKGDPADIALAYVRNRPEVFRLDRSALASLRPAARYRSADGVTHLSWLQTSRGIRAYDSQLNANVTGGGCLVNISGAPVPDLALRSATPSLSAGAALAAAKRDVGASQLAPRARTSPGPERRTEFSNGDRAGLVVFADPDGARLAWRLQVAGRGPYLFDEVVDAESGRVLARHSLTSFASDSSIYDLRPAPGARRSQDLAADATWLDDTAGFTRLKGNNAHAYADTGAPNGFNAGEDVPAGSGTDWVFPHAFFSPVGQTCPAPGCTWNPADAATQATNRSEATTQLFYYVNRFHDYLLQPPIEFTEASHNFERVHSGAAPGAGDHVLAESNDFSGVDNANMSTPSDGFSPRMQMYFFSNPALNSSDDADIVYHEYTHGLSNRLVNNGLGGGLTTNQPRAMGEAWSDWYTLDFLVASGFRTDTATPGQLRLGDYVESGGIRWEAMDCPVGPAVAGCAGTAGAGPGGFTYGDLGKVSSSGFQVHSDGEIWGQTLWDLRTAVGPTAARELITGGMRLSPPDPSYLDMRAAILQADAVAGGARSEVIWQTFAARGMGFKASTAGASAVSAAEDFTVPRALEPTGLRLTDGAPGGDGDGFPEPNERLAVEQDLLNPHSRAVTGVSAELSSTTPGVAIGATGGDYPSTIPAGTPAFMSEAKAVTVPDSAPCGSNLDLTLTVNTDQGRVTIPLERVLGAPTVAPSADVPKTIPDADPAGVASTLTVPGAGTISDLDVAIGSLSHSWVGDLSITLSSPQGTTVTLMSRPGSGSEGAPGNDLSNLVFDDEATEPIADIPATNPPGGYTGRFKPDSSLSAFDSQEAQGTWTLTVRDHLGGDFGTLNSWGLQRQPPSICDVPPPPDPPDVSTGGASAITSTSATLTGTVDPNGTDTDYAFHYGPNEAYGLQTPSTAVSGDSAVPLSAPVTGLASSTTYHYRLVATRNGFEAGQGGDATFTTAAAGGGFSTRHGDYNLPVTPLVQGGVGGTFVPRATFTSTPRTIRLDRRNRIVFRFRASPAGMRGSASFATTNRVSIAARRRVRFGSRSFTVPAGGRVVVRKAVSRARRRTLRRHGRLRVRATVTLGGRKFTRTFTLKPRRR